MDTMAAISIMISIVGIMEELNFFGWRMVDVFLFSVYKFIATIAAIIVMFVFFFRFSFVVEVDVYRKRIIMAVENVIRNRKEDHCDFWFCVIIVAARIDKMMILIDRLAGDLLDSMFAEMINEAVFISLFFFWFTGPLSDVIRELLCLFLFFFYFLWVFIWYFFITDIILLFFCLWKL